MESVFGTMVFEDGSPDDTARRLAVATLRPRLVWIENDEVRVGRIQKLPVTIGRRMKGDAAVDPERVSISELGTVSRKHAEIDFSAGDFRVIATQEKSPTWIDVDRSPPADGDIIVDKMRVPLRGRELLRADTVCRFGPVECILLTSTADRVDNEGDRPSRYAEAVKELRRAQTIDSVQLKQAETWLEQQSQPGAHIGEALIHKRAIQLSEWQEAVMRRRKLEGRPSNSGGGAARSILILLLLALLGAAGFLLYRQYGS